ncbi:DUF6287 domain-containing protein [Streptococcus sp. 27098_8_73]|uniref:DUF6287 domain-containing protein n=1 Tax=Streptococcus sp. 27098_8_73 TaxID=3003668 RepID=UPI00352DE4ED
MKRSKLILLTATALCSAFLLAACSSKPSTEASSSTSQSSKISSSSKSSTKPSAKQSSASNSVTSSSTPQTSSDPSISSQAEKSVENKTPADSNTPTTSGMDVNALANGDFSSIAGTWQDDLGNQLVFDANGLLSHTYRGNESSDYTLVDGQIFEGKYTAILANKAGHHIASFTAIPKGARLYDTGSENPKERILVGQDFTYASQHPYYRVAN